MKKIKITEEIVAAHSICQRKSYQILFRHSEAEEKTYSAFLRERIQETADLYFQSGIEFLPYSSDRLAGKSEIILNAKIENKDFAVDNVYLKKLYTSSELGDYSYEPLIFTSSVKIKPEDRIKVLYIGYVLCGVQKKKPEKSHLSFD